MKLNPNKVCVLVVEDDDSVRETMKLVLESEDYEVHIAEDGSKAVSMLNIGVIPDIVITDLMMPHMTGWELVDTMRSTSRLKTIPVIVYSGVAHYASGSKTLSGAYFLRKPVELDILFKTIKTALTDGFDYTLCDDHIKGL